MFVLIWGELSVLAVPVSLYVGQSVGGAIQRTCYYRDVILVCRAECHRVRGEGKQAELPRV